MDNSSFVSFILKFSTVTKGHGVRDYPPPPTLFFTESITPHNFFRKQKEYTNEFISRVISVQCDLDLHVRNMHVMLQFQKKCQASISCLQIACPQAN